MKAHWFEVVIGIAIVAFVVLLACTLAEASRLERAYSTARAVCEAVKMQGAPVAVIDARCFALEGGQWVDQSAKFEARP